MQQTKIPLTAADLIAFLHLEPLPGEGGFFRQTYKSKSEIPARFVSPEKTGVRAFATCIYYLVTPGSFSALHRVASDEIFHFYLGDPVEMVQITPDGSLSSLVIGNEIHSGQVLQAAVPGGSWQGTRLLKGGQWALMGTTVAPGFEFLDFELGTREAMLKRFPQHAALIEKFTR